jgi:plasmid maintenance system antidote protein VapI
MMPVVDFTHLSRRNAKYERLDVHVANGTTFRALKLPLTEMHRATNVLYLHVHRATRQCYVGITVQEAGKRWFSGIAYRNNRRFGAVLRRDNWAAFDSYVLAFADDRDVLNQAEIDAIAAAGGHKSKFTFNLSPGGDLVAENDKPLIGVLLTTGDVRGFKSGADAARTLGIKNVDMPMAVARKERSSVAGWWFRFEGDTTAHPPTQWGDELRIAAVRLLQGRKVVAINYATGEARTFATTNEAADSLGVHQSHVSMIANGDGVSAKGWWFKFEGDKREPPAIHGQKAGRLKRDRTVYAVNLTTGERTPFSNCTVADDELGIHKGAAAAVAAGERASAGNWWFTYLNDTQPPTEYKGALVARARSKPVVAVEIATGAEQTFGSAKAAAEALGISRAAISYVISGRKAAVRGFAFRFA